MRYGLLLLFLFGLCHHALGQLLECTMDGQAVQAELVDGVWVVIIDGVKYYLLPKERVSSLNEKLKTQAVDIKKLEKDLTASNKYIEQLEKERSAAKQAITDLQKLVSDQKVLIADLERLNQAQDQLVKDQDTLVADQRALIEEQKLLNRDLKKLAGSGKYGLNLGLGLADLPGQDYEPVGSVGFDYKQWTGKFQFGEDYSAFIVGIRLAFGF